MPSPKVQGRRGVAPKKKTKAAARNRPGRPEGSNGQVRDRILDASELLFAERGYAGTTLREVADAAEVTQALINYYFGSKYGLFQEVFLRRGKRISDQRLERLSELERQGPLQVVDIVRAKKEGRGRLALRFYHAFTIVSTRALSIASEQRAG